MQGDPGNADRIAMAQIPGKNIYAVRNQNWKLIYTINGMELYNLSEDPKETNNLANTNRSKVNELMTTLNDLIDKHPRVSLKSMTANKKEYDMLKSLGYIK